MTADGTIGIERLAKLLDAYGARPERWPDAERALALALLARSAEARALRAGAARLDALLERLPEAAPSAGLADRIVRAAAPRGRRLPGWAVVPLAAAAALALWLVVPRAPRPALGPSAVAQLGEYRTPTDALLAASDLDPDDVVPDFGCDAPDVDCGDADGSPSASSPIPWDPQEVHA